MYDEVPVQEVEAPGHVQRDLAALTRHRAAVFPHASAGRLTLSQDVELIHGEFGSPACPRQLTASWHGAT